jgi:purine-nucleoside phosphorylase
MSDLVQRIDGATAAIQARCTVQPKVGVILGTGLGALAHEIERPTTIPFEEIPGFAKTTLSGHAGNVVIGHIAGKPVITFEGRFHYYEGHSVETITLPVRVMRAMGAEIMIVSNAAGCMDPRYDRGDLMIIEDHINMMGINPLVGPNDERLGPRFPDMSRPYDPALIALAESIALKLGIKAHKGVYVALTGPNLETRAEYRFLRMIGADAVGMSTVPEVIVAVHAGLRVLGISVMTDLCLPDALQPANIEEIIAVANAAEPKMTAIVREVIRQAE